MPRIHQLPHEVTTKIAAGEVIERPASVVKELVENSLDAGATRIDVDIAQGGSELIRVVDDGCGIVAEDLPLAFASHATSKLATADDLFRVQTLGFRGEALASISGVAQVTLQSRPRMAPALDTGFALAAANEEESAIALHDPGAEITCEGGVLQPVRAWNGSLGTRIEVRQLFFNTPVRRRFLKSMSTEMGHIAEAITRLALSAPHVSWRLTHNGKAVFDVPSSAGLPDRLGLFFGADVREHLLPIDATQGPARLHGFLTDPACNRGTPRMQYLFVNGRWIRDRSLGHALQEAYRSLIMVGRHCVAFLFVDLPPDLVDVNVHPTKAEVRFRDAQAIYHMLFSTARDTLRRLDLTARFSPGPSSALSLPPGAMPALGSAVWPDAQRVQVQESLLNSFLSTPPSVAPSAAPPPATAIEPRETPADLPARAIQLHDSYIVLEADTGMLVIDQHALHERILYEAWRARIRAGNLETQRLLVPEPLELPAEQAVAALENRLTLAKLGLEIEDFGGNTILVRSYPAIVRRAQPAELLRAAVEHLTAQDRMPSAEQLLDDLLRLMACKAAVKAGDHLGPEEIQALVVHRHLADHTHHCPHGRPTALFFSKHELDKQFKRI
jgi:DNA mismatch repair protein MutL